MIQEIRKGLIVLFLKASVFYCLMLVSIPTVAQNLTETTATDSLTNTSSRVPLPVLGYTPDTGMMFGGTVLQFFYLEPEFKECRPSVFSPVYIYTLKSQILVFMGLGLNWDENRNSLNVVPKYAKFPDQFYGLGRNVSLDNEENYTSKRLALDLDFTEGLE